MHFKCRLQFVSIWTSLKFYRLVRGYAKLFFRLAVSIPTFLTQIWCLCILVKDSSAWHRFQHYFGHITATVDIFMYLLGFINITLGLWSVFNTALCRAGHEAYLEFREKQTNAFVQSKVSSISDKNKGGHHCRWPSPCVAKNYRGTKYQVLCKQMGQQGCKFVIAYMTAIWWRGFVQEMMNRVRYHFSIWLIGWIVCEYQNSRYRRILQ